MDKPSDLHHISCTLNAIGFDAVDHLGRLLPCTQFVELVDPLILPLYRLHHPAVGLHCFRPLQNLGYLRLTLIGVELVVPYLRVKLLPVTALLLDLPCRELTA